MSEIFKGGRAHGHSEWKRHMQSLKPETLEVPDNVRREIERLQGEVEHLEIARRAYEKERDWLDERLTRAEANACCNVNRTGKHEATCEAPERAEAEIERLQEDYRRIEGMHQAATDQALRLVERAERAEAEIERLQEANRNRAGQITRLAGARDKALQRAERAEELLRESLIYQSLSAVMQEANKRAERAEDERDEVLNEALEVMENYVDLHPRTLGETAQRIRQQLSPEEEK